MSKVQTLRVFGKQRLTAAAEEIFELFERTIAEYEEELCRQRKLLDAVLQPQVQLHRTDVQQLLGSKEAVPLEQSSLDQEDPPELPHIKEEQEELWTRQEGEQLPGLEEADITKFTFGAEQTVNPAHIRVSRQFLTECFWRKSLCESVKMSKVQTLRVFGKQKLTAAAEEIFELFERTIAEYEEELCRQRKLLDAVLQPRVHLYRAVQTFTSVPVKSEEDDEEDPQSSQLHHIKSEEIRDVELLKTEADGEDCGGPEPVQDSDPNSYLQPKEIDGPRQLKMEVQFNRADVQQLLKKEEDPPEQQEWSSSQDQEDPPELPHIKEEQEELWINQEGEQLPVLEEADIKFTFTPVPEPDKASDTDSHLQPADDDKTSHFPEPESDDSWDWEDTRERHSNLDPQQHNEVPIRDVDCNLGAISAISSECATTSGHSKHQLDDDEIQAGVRPFGCSVCGKRYRWKNSLNDHMELHAAEIPFSCSLCGKRYRWKRSLSDHMELHAAEKPFSCSLCEKTFNWRENLVRHMKFHTGKPPFTCLFCEKVVRNRTHFESHMSNHTGHKPFSCSVCGKRFGWKKSLASHLSLHSEERLLSCSVCDETFKSRPCLLHHMKIHGGEKPFSCNFCGKRFKKGGNLSRHLEVHTGEEGITCPICKLSFDDDGALAAHKRVHTRSNPFLCSICKKIFQSKYVLVKHMKIHTGEKRFSCPLCGKRFAARNDMIRHMRVHTTDKSSSCRVCHKTFRNVYFFKKHKCVGKSSKNK
ncbi:zinc finger protein 454-like isoform X1 [Sparus aurata]|uniref:zinc finger protein 454-like isoform X1 n=2 Tax=Sparus aurata TaxID=8175 RepID=UPI0011C16605|nr:zinc finger protein 454-like isoform X1 [Sparus aurata]XP_030266975.1 zinc finger protein 454-like isoform X1 [Sparus aurata]XP_030266976.1 zinc finger protein 454-like isoform X1 [Sparus aurata]